MEDFLQSRPQRCCRMCGKCCRVVTTEKSYEELKELSKSGNDFAVDFLGIFEPYSSIEEAKKILPDVVDNILKKLETAKNKPQSLTFYKCKYLSDDNLCTIYDKRPELCERFPVSPWAIIPPGCGFEGWLFSKREEIKKIIRFQKECMLEFEVKIKTSDNPDEIKKLEEAIVKIKNIVDLYSEYGAEDW